MPRDRHGDYFTYRPHWKVIKLTKIAINYVNGGCSVGTHDLGRRYRVLKEGDYPPFKWESAWFRVDVRPNGKLVWGEEVEGPAR